MGNPLPTRRLPRAFAMADLRGTAGWKAEIEAAERLTRTGALPATRLLGLYTDQRPAASGGVWDRARAVQDFDAALGGGTAEDIARTLPPAWAAMSGQNLEIAFAQLFAAQLMGRGLTGDAAALTARIALLAPDYEAYALVLADTSAAPAFAILVALGRAAQATPGTDIERAIVQGFTLPAPAPADAVLIRRGELGNAILSAALRLDRAGTGNPGVVAQSLASLRAVGLEDVARRAALQLLLLER